jgi:hypothetical protein
MTTCEKYTPEKIRDMIPMYLNGTLSKDQIQSFEESIRFYPDLQKELEEFSDIQSVYHRMEKDVNPTSDLLFDRILKNIQADAQPTLEKNKNRVFHTLFQSFAEWFHSPKVAWVVAAVQLVLIAAILIAGPMKQEYRTLSSGQDVSESGVQINIVFKKEAKESDIRATLQKIKANIIQGPSAQGRYTIQIRDKKNMKRVLEILRKTDIIRFAEKAY